MLRKALFACLFSLLALPVSAAPATPLTVAVAANVQYAFDDLAQAFTRETGTPVKPVFNSSGKFTAQIQNGAPFDVFLSADTHYPQHLADQGLAASAPVVYARGQLVLWTLSPALQLDDWQAALKNSTGKIAVANPKLAPYGREAMRVLEQQNLAGPLTPRLVFGESISQTNQYIYSQAAELGFTAKSVVVSPEMRGKGRWLAIPPALYLPIEQAMIVTRHGAASQPEASRRFAEFMRGPQARRILEAHGYLVP